MVEFLEEKLEILGLNPFEAAEFIIYWLPLLESNPYNFIHFATEQWARTAKLTVTPRPNTSIRILMLWREVNKDFEIPTRTLDEEPPRLGFTLVEWGVEKTVRVNNRGQKMKSVSVLLVALYCNFCLSCSFEDKYENECGNGIIENNEDCEGDEFPHIYDQNCKSLGFNAGTYSCNDSCKLDLSECRSYGVCGDGVLSPLEPCDNNLIQHTQ
ncbi:MAG: hypothetical protein ACQES9_13920 [Myxococcota bacterium]